MKKSTKILLIVALSLVLLGCVVFLIYMSANHWNLDRSNSVQMVTTKVEIPEDFRSITVRSETEIITFLPSENGKCEVVFNEWEEGRHTAEVHSGTLTVGLVGEVKWLDVILPDPFDAATITVYLPKREYDSLLIEESTGSITIPEDFRFGSMELRLSTGTVRCGASAEGLLRIKSATGAVLLEELSAGELDLSTSTGSVGLSSVACKGSVSLSVTTGKAELTNVTCKNLRSDGSTGKLVLNSVVAAEELSVTRSTGSVELNGCDAGSISIETDTGSVTGSLLTDKIFYAQSDTGKVDVPRTVTGGICEIRTDTGNIRIEISPN